LRQPLNALGLLLGELREAQTASDRQAILADMDFALRLSGAWLDSLAALDKAQQGLLRRHHQNLLLQPVFARLAAEHGPQLAQRGLGLRVVPSRAAVRCDPASLRSILAALLDNAGKFTRQGRVLLGCIASGEEERIFDPFFRLENEVRPRDRGLGLGLAYARLLARDAGGELVARSRLDRWSCFAVTLPPGQAPEDRADTLAAAAPAGGYDMGDVSAALGNPLQGAEILLCTASDGEALQNSLQGWGSVVRPVAPPDLASALRTGEAFDLLLTDQTAVVAAEGPRLLASRRESPAVVLISETDEAATTGLPAALRLHSIKRPVKLARLRSLCHFALTHRDA
jgi:histidine kinase